MVSESGRLINELRAAGVNMESIGQAIGRNRSLVRQVGTGAKPGHNLQRSLEQLRDRLSGLDAGAANTTARQAPAEVGPPTRRVTKAGGIARVRKPVTITGRGGAWSSTTLKRQASRHGANAALHPIEAAAERGQTIAVTVGLSGSAHVVGRSGSSVRKHSPDAAHHTEMVLGEAGEVLADWQASGETFTGYVLGRLVGEGYVTMLDQAEPAEAVTDIEVRAFTD